MSNFFLHLYAVLSNQKAATLSENEVGLVCRVLCNASVCSLCVLNLQPPSYEGIRSRVKPAAKLCG